MHFYSIFETIELFLVAWLALHLFIFQNETDSMHYLFDCTILSFNIICFMHTLSDGTASKAPKEYVDPWVSRDTKCIDVSVFLACIIIQLIYISMQDYTNRDYPVTLPLRRPYSGDPGILLVLFVLCCKIFFSSRF